MTDDQSIDSVSGISELAALIVEARPAEAHTQIIGLTGSVASGKTTLAKNVSAILAAEFSVDSVSTDGFLLPNDVLAERDLTLRKGFPETYDHAAKREAIERIRGGEATFPVYSHVTYQVEPELARTLAAPDILFLEGLGFSAPTLPPRPDHAPDLLVYLDADIADLEHWYLERFIRLWRAAETDPASFYARFLHMSEPELIAFATSVWTEINVRNLVEHIEPLRAVADIVVKKNRAHVVSVVEDRRVSR